MPQTLPITTEQYQCLVDQGTFRGQKGQIELIYGKIVRMNPQGPVHADPIDELTEWSVREASKFFRIRIEKPIEIAKFNSTPEPDVAWVTRRRYAERHPAAEDVHLLIEVSHGSQAFDRGEKLRLYAEAGIPEYWIVDVPSRSLEILTRPAGGTFQQSTVYGVADTVCPACLPSARLAVARLFNNLVQEDKKK